MSHWSSGLPVCCPSQGTQVQIPWGDSCETRILLLELIIMASSEAGFVPNHHWPSCWQCDNPTWSHTAFLSWFHARCRSPFRLHNQRSWLLGGSPVESLHSHHVSLVQWTTCLLPVTRDPGSNPLGGLMWNQDFPVSVVSLQVLSCLGTVPWDLHLWFCHQRVLVHKLLLSRMVFRLISQIPLEKRLFWPVLGCELWDWGMNYCWKTGWWKIPR
jgi:hypothetical protein